MQKISWNTDYDVIVVGAGLTGLTTAFRLKRGGKRVLVIEKSERTGGQIHTFSREGYVFESGPNTGVMSYPEVSELFADLAEYCSLETALPSAKKRLIWKGNRFHALPSGLLSAITTPLFTWTDKLRILGEPFRAKGTNPDESVGELARRRLGQSFLDYAVDPFLSGVYAGDPMALPTRLALPKLYALEQEYGSFIRGAVAKARIPKTNRDRLATKEVYSATGGLSGLTDALTKALGSDAIRTGMKRFSIVPDHEKWVLTFDDEAGNAHAISSERVVTTTGAYALPEFLPFVPDEDMAVLTSLNYAPVVQVAVGVKRHPDPLYHAFGGLVPSREKRDVLGILFPSACFEGRAPEGRALYSFFIGGMRHPEMVDLSDDELRIIVNKSLHEMLHYDSFEIELFEVFRHRHAIPQYELSSEARFHTIDKLQNDYPGLILAGNMRNGIGMADRIKQACEIAKLICEDKV